ncbi:MAG: transcription elongation factor GreA [Gemmiger sp.]
MAKEVVVTREGLKKLEDELNMMRTDKRREVAEKIKVARGYGDLSENAEYDAAKEEQAFVEARIADLEAMLKNARVIDENDLNADTVSVGMHVRILAEGDDPEDAEEYDITGSTEADVDMGRISDESPVGAALIGHKVGDEAEITLPNGSVIVYKVLAISRSK